ncbi:DUF1446 domain-containing protein [Sulfidibacter corallicola]|uniref:DUF1446 domain-containing protein n=1 Tax=Sulfidibacter corallicola TaxID=2818388 RepID=A0A8A4TL03_SULCO|nr:acyclic terpene utilization AtuA family protein [Sulfidibacter corallicola]QTD49884.1 DUF1446 domain-containing protein [Sulfidibacter corallicola]
MVSPDTIRIGNASAFWGDSQAAAAQLVRARAVDFLTFDYLAEITMSLLAGKKLKDPAAGYPPDFVQVLRPLLPAIQEQGIRVVANAGGVNPLACRDALQALVDEAGLSLRIAVVLGDDLMSQVEALRAVDPRDMETGEPLPERLVSANAYLGAAPIVAALDRGADIVITGRCVDSALALAPLVHTFGWKWDDYDLLAAGCLAGHIIECGTHCTGGNFTDWHRVPGFENMGFPVITCGADGGFVVSKPPGTGGLVTPATVGEQFVYEMGDPARYILPDVVCDFSRVRLDQDGPDRVRVSGASGHPPTDTYKVCATFLDGYRADVAFLLMGMDAVAKGRRVGQAIIAKVRGMFQVLGFDDFQAAEVAVLGAEDSYGPRGPRGDSREVTVRLSVRHPRKEALGLFAREIAQAGTAMAPGLTGLIGGRPHPTPAIRLFQFLMPKDRVAAEVVLGEERWAVPLETSGGFDPEIVQPATYGALETDPCDARVPLVRLAWARSGDKGDHANIGVIARDPVYLPYLRAALTPDAVRHWFDHLMDGEVVRWDLPGVRGLNFLLGQSLGGGGMASLRPDPQGKAYAQILLEMPVPLPAELAARAQQNAPTTDG